MFAIFRLLGWYRNSIWARCLFIQFTKFNLYATTKSAYTPKFRPWNEFQKHWWNNYWVSDKSVWAHTLVRSIVSCWNLFVSDHFRALQASTSINHFRSQTQRPPPTWDHSNPLQSIAWSNKGFHHHLSKLGQHPHCNGVFDLINILQRKDVQMYGKTILRYTSIY